MFFQSRGCITIADDGDGVTKEKYEAALQSVMKTQKTRDKLGQFDTRVFDPAKDYLWPIPQKEIDINTNLGQNFGY